MNLGTATNLDLDNSLERRFALRADWITSPLLNVHKVSDVRC
jgi:hypothetical protein